MKKGILILHCVKWYNAIFTFIFIVALLSCQRETVHLETKQKVSEPNGTVIFENGYLNFTSLNSYENTIKDSLKLANLEQLTKSENLPSTSARTSSEETPPNSTLVKLLNRDNIMQVGKWILKLKFKEKIVLAIDEKYKDSLYDYLNTGQTSENIYKFTFDDDVLVLLEQGYTESPKESENARPAFLCCCGIDGQQFEHTIPYPATTGNSSHNMTAYNTYEAYGAYFESSTRIVYKTYPINYQPDTPIGQLQLSYYYKQKCNNPDEGSYQGNLNILMNPSGPNNGQFTYKQTVYTGSKGLRALRLYSAYSMYSAVGLLIFAPNEIRQGI